MNYFSVPGPLYAFFVALFVINVIFGLISLRHFFKETASPRIKKQAKLLFWFSLIGYGSGTCNYLLVYDIHLPGVAETSNYGVLILSLSLAYIIFRYKFLDIEVVIKKTLVFAGVVAAAVSVIAFPFALIQAVIGKALGVPDPFVLMALGIASAVLIYRPVERVLVDMTDRYLFQKKQEIKEILKSLSEKVATVADLHQVGQMILSTLMGTFRLESGMMVVYNQKDQKYLLTENSGLLPEEFVQSARRYYDRAGVQEYFKDHPFIVSLDDPASGELPRHVSEWMKAAKARVCIPLFMDEDQNGFLVLGKKKSDQEFSREEIDFFPTIESQVSLAIRNARLVETVVEEREAKVKAEHLAQRVSFAGLIKHEIKNKLVHIQMPANATSTYCIPRLKKLFKEQDEEFFLEICNEINEGSKKINSAAEQILTIAETASGGVDENDKAFREMSCKIIWDDAKRESGLLEKCDFESKMPDGSSVYGNYHALQRTFVNLITNAYDAMKNNDDPLIKLRCSYENIEGKPAAYFEVEDSGCGIPKETQVRIFEDGFSTKSKPEDKDLISSGHGQGLAACKMYIESIHHGKIWVESEPGRGTTFKFWVPMREGNGSRRG